MAENELIAREVERMRGDLTTIHSSSSQANALAVAEVDNALSSVSVECSGVTLLAEVAPLSPMFSLPGPGRSLANTPLQVNISL